MIDRENVIKALKCRKDADNRCGNPCEYTGFCHYAKAIRGADGEIYLPYICDKERICADSLALLKEQENLKQKMWNALYAEEDNLENKYTGTVEHDNWFTVYRGWLQRGFEIAITVIAEQDGM